MRKDDWQIKTIIEMLDDIYDTCSAFKDFVDSNGDSMYWYNWEDQIRYSYNDFYLGSGASRGVIIFYDYDYVVKFDFREEQDQGYSQREVNLYQTAKEHNMQEFFAPAYHVGTFHYLDLYVMAKADINEDLICSCVYDSHHYEDNIDKIPEEVSLYMSLDDIKAITNVFAEFYSIEVVNKLLAFCEKFNIFDIHDANMGLIGGNPVLIDYAGYN